MKGLPSLAPQLSLAKPLAPATLVIPKAFREKKLYEIVSDALGGWWIIESLSNRQVAWFRDRGHADGYLTQVRAATP